MTGFWLAMLKPLSGKENQRLQKYKIDPKITSKVGRWKHFRKWFRSYLKVRNDCSERSNVTFLTFFVNFRGMNLKPFSWKANQSLQNDFILNFSRGRILEIGFAVSLKSNKNVLSVWIWNFLFWKCFWGKQGKVQKTVEIPSWT